VSKSIFGLFLFLCVIGCKRTDSVDSPPLNDKPIQVLATTGMIADAVRAVGGEDVEVECLMGPGVDPHLYKAKPSDTQKLRDAQVIAFNGLHLEGQIDNLLRSQEGAKKTIAVADGLPNLIDGDVGSGTHYDPHVWFDVKLWMKCVENIRDALMAYDPARSSRYRERANAYLKELDNLHVEIINHVARLPKEKRVLITCHDAFGYFGRAYGFDVHGLQGVSTASEASGRDVQSLADIIGQRKVKAVFAETSVADKGLKAVLLTVEKKYGGFRCVLAKESLYSDALGEPNEPAGTYIGMVRHNVRAIVSALGE
jgi:manganese/zinc/iron transport system substrate-binding protein